MLMFVLHLELFSVLAAPLELNATISGIKFGFGFQDGSIKRCLYIFTSTGEAVRIFLNESSSIHVNLSLSTSLFAESRGCPIIYMQSLDSEGRIIIPDQQNRRKITTLHHVMISQTSIRVYCESETELLHQTRFKEVVLVQESLIYCEICRVKDIPHIIAISTSKTLSIFSFPSLDLVWKDSLPADTDVNRLDQIHINAHDGCLTYWTIEGSYETICFLSDSQLVSQNTQETTNSKPNPIRLYDLYEGKKWINRHFPDLPHGTTTNFSIHEKLLKSNLDPANQRHSSRNSDAFSHIRNAFDERGERLQELDVKFSRLADASRSFVDTVKEMNDKQAKKKWWQL